MSQHAFIKLNKQAHIQNLEAGGVLQRKCDKCRKKKGVLQRSAKDSVPETVPSIVHEVLRSPGAPLDAKTKSFMEPRFGHDFSQVRVHTDAHATESARAVNALAYTVGPHVVFGRNQYAPETNAGQGLMAHELAHVIQQRMSDPPSDPLKVAPESTPEERSADRAAHSVRSPASPVGRVSGTIQRRAAPYIKKITVHLTPKQSADIEWKGTPPSDAPGNDHFTVSTGKGYGDPGDPPGTCSRKCCRDPMTQCAPPYNQPKRVGACCTYYGTSFWTGVPEADHNGWKYWTPIQPFYSSRGIALHQHTDVTGDPIGHGCVRMEEANAKRIHDYSNGRRTNVTIDGRAAPVACEPERRCTTPKAITPSGPQGALEEEGMEGQMTAGVEAIIPGLEGEMT